MPQVSLSGQLICQNNDELTTVLAQLPRHIELTRLEPGCISFEVSQTDNPLVWQVDELFVDEDSFAAHQLRVAESKWGRATAGIERHYVIQGLTTA
ncbi:MAG: antibiotic biosynthesis monooxygenase [Ancrocorticia sp.]